MSLSSCASVPTWAISFVDRLTALRAIYLGLAKQHTCVSCGERNAFPKRTDRLDGEERVGGPTQNVSGTTQQADRPVEGIWRKAAFTNTRKPFFLLKSIYECLLASSFRLSSLLLGNFQAWSSGLRLWAVQFLDMKNFHILCLPGMQTTIVVPPSPMREDHVCLCVWACMHMNVRAHVFVHACTYVHVFSIDFILNIPTNLHLLLD